MPRRKAAFYGLVQALDVGGLRFDEAKKWGHSPGNNLAASGGA